MIRRPHLAALDGVRGIAAVAVVFEHLHGATLGPWATSMYLAVDVFFALSGFVLCYRYYEDVAQGRFEPLAFVAGRVARLVPMHVCALAALLLSWRISGYAPGYGAQAWPTLVHALCLTDALGLATDLPRWNTVTWSLSVELYVACWGMTAMSTWGGRRAHALWLSAIALGGYVWLAQGVGNLSPGHGMACAWLSWPVIRGAAGLSVGALAYFAFAALSARAALRPRYLPTLLAAAALPLVFGQQAHTRSDFLLPMLLLPLLPMLAEGSGPAAWVLRLAPLQLLGRLSYSIYLLGWPAIAIAYWSGLDGRQTGAVMRVIACLVGVSWLTFYGIERPAQRWLRRRLLGLLAGPPRATPEGPVAAAAGSWPPPRPDTEAGAA